MSAKLDQLMKEFEESLARIRPRRRPPAEVLSFPPLLREQALWRQQQIVDQSWERTRALEAEMAARSCHVGPGDPDWRPRAS
jgi:hypothetical protein